MQYIEYCNKHDDIINVVNQINIIIYSWNSCMQFYIICILIK